MKIKQVALASMMGLATIAPAKAQIQKPVQTIFETGFNGIVKKEMGMYGGMNFGVPMKNNFADLFLGGSIDASKTASFLGMFIDEYSWNRNLSSWLRGILSVSKENINTTLEASPIKANLRAGKFNFSINPAYAIFDNTAENKVTRGINTIFQSSYSMTPSDKMFLEVKYSSSQAENIKDIRFGSLGDNLSYIISYQKKF